MPWSLPACPLIKSPAKLSRALICAHCRLRGEILKAERGIPLLIPLKEAQAGLADVEAMLGFLGVDFDPSAIRAVMARPEDPERHPLGIATLDFSRDLLRLHMRLKGELIKHAEGEAVLVQPAKTHELLAAIGRLLGLLRVDFQPKALPSIRTRPQSTPLGHGGISTGIVRALKVAEQAMTYEEIVQTVFGHKREHLSVEQYRRFQQGIRWTCRKLYKRGRIEATSTVGLRDGFTRQRWRLRRRPLMSRAGG